MLIIDDDLSLRLDLPRMYGVDDLPIILQDRSFGSDGSLAYNPSPMEIAYGTRGDTVIVNGAIGFQSEKVFGLWSPCACLIEVAIARNPFDTDQRAPQVHVASVEARLEARQGNDADIRQDVEPGKMTISPELI
jgi:FtsP/CotA-like multicopper oxidase with cupredoxin domain